MPFVVAIYILLFVLTFFLLNVRLSVEWVAIALIGAAILTGRAKAFFLDWGVFIVAVVAWQVTDGLALKFNFPWHTQEMITADRWLFQPVLHGQLPTIWLQDHLFNPKILSWIDVLAVVVYSLHFLLPLGAGFVLWLASRETFQKYAVCFVVAAVLGFATYIVFPAVPPWMAAQYARHCVGNAACYKLPGNPFPYVPWVYDVWAHTMKGWVTTNNGNAGFAGLSLGYDQVGAMPSEHVMYPTLVFLFMRRQFGRIGYLMVPYVLLVLFCIVYMGQHWVIDGIVGAGYAIVVYVAVLKGYPAMKAYLHPKPTLTPTILSTSTSHPLSDEIVGRAP
jgi:membrane-associated phospholipid phosphatase